MSSALAAQRSVVGTLHRHRGRLRAGRARVRRRRRSPPPAPAPCSPPPARAARPAPARSVQYAYSILSNPRLRSIYDSYGEQGLKAYESYVNFAEGSSGDSGGTLLPLAPAQLFSALCGAVGLLVALFTALCVDILLKANGTTDAALSLLLIPLWILDVIALLAVYIFIFSTARKGSPNQGAVMVMVSLIFFIAFQVLVVVRVDGAAPTLPWVAVFGPLYGTEALSFARSLARCRPSAHEADKAASKAHPSYAWHVLLTMGWSLARVATVVLIPLKMDEIIGLDWSLVFTPLYSYILIYFVFACRQLQAPVHNEREQMVVMGHRMCALFTLLATVLLVLATLTLNGTIGTWLVFFMPAFVLAACFCCCCFCVVCCVSMMPKSGPVDVPPGDGMDSPRPAPSPPASTSPPTPPHEDAPLLPSSFKRGPDRV